MYAKIIIPSGKREIQTERSAPLGALKLASEAGRFLKIKLLVIKSRTFFYHYYSNIITPIKSSSF